jgi:hypothetical protein
VSLLRVTINKIRPERKGSALVTLGSNALLRSGLKARATATAQIGAEANKKGRVIGTKDNRLRHPSFKGSRDKAENANVFDLTEPEAGRPSRARAK